MLLSNEPLQALTGHCGSSGAAAVPATRRACRGEPRAGAGGEERTERAQRQRQGPTVLNGPGAPKTAGIHSCKANCRGQQPTHSRPPGTSPGGPAEPGGARPAAAAPAGPSPPQGALGPLSAAAAVGAASGHALAEGQKRGSSISVTQRLPPPTEPISHVFKLKKKNVFRVS